MISKQQLLQSVLLIFGLFGILQIGQSQNSDDAREVTNTYLIKNAFVVQKPGTTLPKTSILIKDGMIHSVGANIKTPYDAKVIDADSMYIYAGFIDACSHAGIKKPEDKGRPTVKNPGNPPKDLAGITPQYTVRDAISEKVDKSMTDLKDLGFGYVHVVPRGRMLPGQGSVLSTGGGKLDKTILKENISQFAQFRSARRMFPATTIGVMSQFRDLMKNAYYSDKYETSYNANPTGLTRPEKSKELEALYPVVNKQMPVFFYTPKVKDVNRALILNKELGYNMVLTGVRQGWPLMNSITQGKHQVVLSLKLPEVIKDKDDDAKDDAPEDDKKGKKAGKEKEMNKEKSDDSVMEKGREKKKGEQKEKKKKEDDPEMIMLKEKKKKSYDEYVGQASMFEKKGVAFSFSTLDTKSKDIRPNILRMVKGGLSEKAALAALTTNPANLLGISSMAGTVEKGKIANLFITDKSYFDEKAKIKYIINDGIVKENKEKKKKKKSGDGGPVELEGLWSYSVEVPGESQSGTIKMSGSSDDLTVELDNSYEPGEFDVATKVAMDGNNLTFDFSSDGMTFSIDITFDGEDFEGNVTVPGMGSFPMTGSKKPE